MSRDLCSLHAAMACLHEPVFLQLASSGQGSVIICMSLH